MSRIFLLDHDVQFADSLKVKLIEFGNEVTVAHSGEGAFALAKEMQPDLVVTNVFLPAVTGYELCRQLRRDPQLYRIGILFMTPFRDEPEIAHGIEQGADDSLAKPFRLEELYEKLTSLSALSENEKKPDQLSKMPGMQSLKREIDHRLARGEACAVCHLSIDGLREYQQIHGRDRSHDVLRNMSKLLKKLTAETGIYESHVAHLGGEHFSALMKSDDHERYCSAAISAFNNIMHLLHSRDEINRGCMLLKNKQGTMLETPLLSLSISVAHSGRRHLRNAKKVFEILSQAQKMDVSMANGRVRIDRREARA
jgi:PleD family two-component response regulator